MEPRDAVKLAYQSEFAGGHLIRDRRESLARLKTELAGVPPPAGPPPGATHRPGKGRLDHCPHWAPRQKTEHHKNG